MRLPPPTAMTHDSWCRRPLVLHHRSAVLTCPLCWSDRRIRQCRRWSAWAGRCFPSGRMFAAADTRRSDSGWPLRSQTWCWRACSLTSTCRCQSPLRVVGGRERRERGGRRVKSSQKRKRLWAVLSWLDVLRGQRSHAAARYSPTQRMLKQNPCVTDLLTSWSGRLSNPTCPPKFRLRFSSFWVAQTKQTVKTSGRMRARPTWGRH